MISGSVGGGVHFVFDRIANLLYEEIEQEQESKQLNHFRNTYYTFITGIK